MVERDCENQDATRKVKSSDMFNKKKKRYQPLYEVNAVSGKRIVRSLYQNLLLLCKFLDTSLASQ